MATLTESGRNNSRASNIVKPFDNGVNNPGYDAVEANGGVHELTQSGGDLEKKAESSGGNQLKRTMGYRQGFALMVGLILGSGIFLSPGLVATETNSTGMMMIIWAVAGALGMMGALCYCELASIFKLAGSNYVNVLKIYGNAPAFLCAWTTCLVIDPASIAAIGLTIGVYLVKPFYETDEKGEPTAKLIAFIVICIAYTVNCISVKFSSRVQSCFAVAQVSSVLFVISLGIWQLSEKKTENFKDAFNTTGGEDTTSVIHVGIALFSALWSYDGWSQMSNAVEEMENMERNLLLTIMTAFPFVIFCYICVNISLLTLLNRAKMAASKAVGVEFVELALGHKAAYAMMIIVGLSAYGTLNGTLFACPRLTLAAAREGHMPVFLSYINKKSLAPMPATTLTGIIALLMLIPSQSSLNKLILLFSQAQWVLYSASILGVVILRIRQPNLERPFKVFILIPIVMFIVSATLVIIPFFRNPMFSLGLFGFILAGLPVYYVFVHRYLSLPNFFIDFMEMISQKLQLHCGMVPCRPEDL